MKIEIEISDDYIQDICDWLERYDDVKVTVEDLKANPKLVEFLQVDCETLYHEHGNDGYENMDMAEELGYDDDEDE